MQPQVIEPHDEMIHDLIYRIIPEKGVVLRHAENGWILSTKDIAQARRFMTAKAAKNEARDMNKYFTNIVALQVRYATLEEEGPTTPSFQPREPNRGRGQKRYVFGTKKGDVGEGGPSLNRRLSDRSEAGGTGPGG